MKNIFKTLLAVLAVTTVLIACKKEENQVVFEGGSAPVLTASGTTVPLGFATQAAPALTLNWTNPDYRFTTGLSSQNVTYTIEIDTAGGNFASTSKQTVAVSNDLSITFTQGQFNDYLLNQLQLAPGVARNIEIRVTSNLVNKTVPLISNKLSFTVTPFAIPPKVAPPASQQLFMVGNASPGGWNNPVPEPAQKFTRVSETLYELTVNISPGGSYLFLPVNGSWDAKYGFTGGNNENNVNGDDFKANGADMLAPAASGNHKIVVDFQRGKWTITKL